MNKTRDQLGSFQENKNYNEIGEFKAHRTY